MNGSEGKKTLFLLHGIIASIYIVAIVDTDLLDVNTCRPKAQELEIATSFY